MAFSAQNLEKSKLQDDVVFILTAYVVNAVNEGNFDLGQSKIKNGSLYLNMFNHYLKIDLENRQLSTVEDLNDINQTGIVWKKTVVIATRTLLAWAGQINESILPI